MTSYSDDSHSRKHDKKWKDESCCNNQAFVAFAFFVICPICRRSKYDWGSRIKLRCRKLFITSFSFSVPLSNSFYFLHNLCYPSHLGKSYFLFSCSTHFHFLFQLQWNSIFSLSWLLCLVHLHQLNDWNETFDIGKHFICKLLRDWIKTALIWQVQFCKYFQI